MNNNQENNDFNDSELTHSFSDKEKSSIDSSEASDISQGAQSTDKYSQGELLKFIRVRFPGHARSYPFLIGNRRLKYGQKVVAMSDRGMAVGYVNSFPYTRPFKKSMLPIKSINKLASDEDIKKEEENYKKQKSTETLCQGLIEKHNLDMNLTHVEFTQFGKKVVFYFIAPARVDFRGLVKDLVTELKLRIELRQISVRDRAASQGALGPCGRELCCSSFLSKYGNTNIKMAKNQNLTLNYSKLNGVCGQLKCCLKYEDEVYSEKRKRLPSEGRIIQTTDGERGKVFRLHILSEQFDLLTNKGKIKRYINNCFDKEISPAKANMPQKFDHISDETNVVIGLNELESKNALEFEKNIQELKLNTLLNTQEIFKDLTEIGIENQTETSLKKEVDSFSKSSVVRVTHSKDILNPTESSLKPNSANREDKKTQTGLSKESDVKYSKPSHRGTRSRNNLKNKKFNRSKRANKPEGK